MMGDASNWLAMRDYRLDDGFVEQFRQRFPCGYSDPAQARLRDDTPAIQSLDESSSWLKHVLVVE
jgi:hypothetical protein